MLYLETNFITRSLSSLAIYEAVTLQRLLIGICLQCHPLRIHQQMVIQRGVKFEGCINSGQVNHNSHGEQQLPV